MLVYNPESPALYSLESYEPSELSPEEIDQNNHFIKSTFLNRDLSRNQINSNFQNISKFNILDSLNKKFNHNRPLSDNNLYNKYSPNIYQYNNLANKVPIPVLKPAYNTQLFKPIMNQNINYAKNINSQSLNYLNVQPQMNKCKSSKFLHIVKHPQNNFIASNKILLPMKCRQLSPSGIVHTKQGISNKNVFPIYRNIIYNRRKI